MFFCRKEIEVTKNPYRLGEALRPFLYEVFLEPDLKKFTFEGVETIHFNLGRTVSSLTLHAADLKVREVSITSEVLPAYGQKADTISYDEKMETVTFHFKKPVKAGINYLLHLKFSGVLNDKMHGFYRTSYTVGGKKRWGAATQFEATDARRAFPCVDEPAAKARFRAAIRVPGHVTALSNMPVESRRLERLSGKQMLIYQTTPVMPTYLLCFVIAELECLKGRDKNGVPIGIWTTPGNKEQGRFALEVAKHTLPYFSEWFGIPYALPKLDMVALPDFASGAMENWGLVTYRETALLVDAKNSSAAACQRVAEVIDHELAHQWFGNLVTMEWWTDLWLNEGFASYMGPKAVDHQFPEWKIWSQFMVSDYFTALHDDALKNSHPIEIPVQNPHEIREIFDPITYSKGSSVNRMLEHYLGEEVFRKGLRRYLKRFAYRNARTVDLWKSLEEVSGQPVRSIMASFTKQEGYPVLKVEKKEKEGGAVLTMEQSRFIFDGSADPKKSRWKVPVTLLTEGQTKIQTHLLDSRKATVTLPSPGGEWVKLNPGQSGFYRTSYASGILNRLMEAVKKEEISSLDCMGLLDDAFAQTRAGLLKTTETLDLLSVCRGQTDYNLWLTLSGITGSIENIVPEAAAKEYADFSRGLFRTVAERSGWERKSSDTHLDLLRRSLVIGRLGHFNERTVVDQANGWFLKFTRGEALDPNLRGSVFGIVAEHGAAPELQRLMSLYKKTGLQEEKVRILRALTRFRGVPEIKQVLDFSLSGQVRTQDAYVLLAGFGANQSARELNWHFVKTHWKDIARRYESGSVGLLGHILEGSASGFKDKKHLKEARQFFKSHRVPGTERTCKQTIEMIENGIAWLSRDSEEVGRWLKTRLARADSEVK